MRKLVFIALLFIIAAFLISFSVAQAACEADECFTRVHRSTNVGWRYVTEKKSCDEITSERECICRGYVIGDSGGKHYYEPNCKVSVQSQSKIDSIANICPTISDDSRAYSLLTRPPVPRQSLFNYGTNQQQTQQLRRFLNRNQNNQNNNQPGRINYLKFPGLSVENKRDLLHDRLSALQSVSPGAYKRSSKTIAGRQCKKDSDCPYDYQCDARGRCVYNGPYDRDGNGDYLCQQDKVYECYKNHRGNKDKIKKCLAEVCISNAQLCQNTDGGGSSSGGGGNDSDDRPRGDRDGDGDDGRNGGRQDFRRRFDSPGTAAPLNLGFFMDDDKNDNRNGRYRNPDYTKSTTNYIDIKISREKVKKGGWKVQCRDITNRGPSEWHDLEIKEYIQQFISWSSAEPRGNEGGDLKTACRVLDRNNKNLGEGIDIITYDRFDPTVALKWNSTKPPLSVEIKADDRKVSSGLIKEKWEGVANLSRNWFEWKGNGIRNVVLEPGAAEVCVSVMDHSGNQDEDKSQGKIIEGRIGKSCIDVPEKEDDDDGKGGGDDDNSWGDDGKFCILREVRNCLREHDKIDEKFRECLDQDGWDKVDRNKRTPRVCVEKYRICGRDEVGSPGPKGGEGSSSGGGSGGGGGGDDHPGDG